MSSGKYYRISLKLHPERDADLIAWLEQQERGCRSQGIREMLRVGLGFTKQEQMMRDLDSLRQVIASELKKALESIQFIQGKHEQNKPGRSSGVEMQYGAKLNNLLGSL